MQAVGIVAAVETKVAEMNGMNKLKKMLCGELEEIAAKLELSAGDLETLNKLTDTVKNIDKIEMLEEPGYSQRGSWGYEKGNSYKSRKTERLAEKLEELLDDCRNGKEREAICNCIDRIKEL